MNSIKFTLRQQEIIKLVKENGPITSEALADKLNVTRAALRPDLAILTRTDILEARPKVGYIYANNESYNAVYEYIRRIKVQEIMSKPVIAEESTTVYDAIVQLFLNDAGTLFVVNKDILVGVVSRKDFLKIAMGGTDMNKVPVGVVMTRMPNIIFAEAEDSVYTAAQKIMEHQVDSLPVVQKILDNRKESLKIIGKVSKTNITNLFVNLSKKI